MRDLYSVFSANYPKLGTDTFFVDYGNTFRFDGYIDDTFRFIRDFQSMRSDLWERFVLQFRTDADFDGGWRGEYWGKMMRGSCFVYSYTKDPELYATLRDAVVGVLDSCDESGRISSYPKDNEFFRWDLWSRKYVLLGLQYFLEITDEADLSKRIIDSMTAQVDYIIERIGPRCERKLPITDASGCWQGLNSSSILEPVVRLYSITKEQRFLDFATYIVDCGGTRIVNIFDLAYENRMFPYLFPVTKAYEMISCFEGLLEYYRIVGNEKHRTAVINFADKILESDFTIIGSCGCTHELFDHSTVRQANTTNGRIQQETCVTVTLMKFMYQLTLLTGNPKYVDAFETAFYNAYLGAVNTEKVIEPTIRENHPNLCLEALPFDSYSPLTAGTRGNGVGGFQIMSDNHYYGCCACIGAVGLGLYPKMMLLTSKDGLAFNLYTKSVITSFTPSGKPISFRIDTAFPSDGNICITLNLKCEESFAIKLRNPSWSINTLAFVNGEAIPCCDGYITIDRMWRDGDVITLSLDMTTAVLRPIPYGSQIIMNDVRWEYDYTVPSFDAEDPVAKNHIALRRGPIILAQDSRLGYSVDNPVSIEIQNESVSASIPNCDTAPYKHMVEVLIPLQDGNNITLTDYASAGKLWTDESKIAAWILTK
ncbi:MAG: glycoside hydrolase family 127 protein [Clostridia bacterium]|nr:glycoside hydrolase family 127 protein [Clostridia bacterium]